MVGPMKSLLDLRQIEANILVVCRDCGHKKLLDREEVIAGRLLHREPMDWSGWKATAVCRSPSCSSANVRIETPAFSDQEREIRHRRAEVTLVNVALKALTDAAYSRPPADKLNAVRLSLRVLAHHGRVPAAMLTQLWSEFADQDQKAWNMTHQHVRCFTKSLLDKRFPVWAELR